MATITWLVISGDGVIIAEISSIKTNAYLEYRFKKPEVINPIFAKT